MELLVAVVTIIAVVAAVGSFEAKRKSITAPMRKGEQETSEWEVVLEIALDDSAGSAGEQMFVHQAGNRITGTGLRCSVKLEDLSGFPVLVFQSLNFTMQRMRVHPQDVASAQDIIQGLRNEWNGVTLPEQDLRSVVVAPPRKES